MYRVYLAIHFLLRRPINALGVIGVMLGVWALIVIPSIFTGYLAKAGEHLQSSVSDLSARRLPRDKTFEELRPILEADPGVAAVTPRIVWQGLLHPSSNKVALPTQDLGSRLSDTPLISILGIDPRYETSVTSVADWAQAEGTDLLAALDGGERTEGEPAPLVVSRDRAGRESLELDRPATITLGRFQGTRSSEQLRLDSGRYRIAGFYESSYAAFDALNVLMHIDDLGRALGMREGHCNEIAIRLREGADPRSTAERLERALNAGSERFFDRAIVRTWSQTNAGQLASIEHQRGLLRLVLIVIVVVSGFLVFATLSMMVTEKTRDIGTLTAMGADAGGITSLFMTCGLAITALGVVLGLGLGALTAHYLNDINEFCRSAFDVDLFPTRIYNLREVPYELEPGWMALVAVGSLALGVVIAMIPAWRAGRQDPLAPLRAE